MDQKITNLDVMHQQYVDQYKKNCSEDEIYDSLKCCLDYLEKIKNDVEVKLVKWTREHDWTNEQQSVIGSLDELLASEIYKHEGKWRCDPNLPKKQEPCQLYHIQRWLETMFKILNKMIELIQNYHETDPFVEILSDIELNLLPTLCDSSVIFENPLPRVLRTEIR